MIDEEKIADMGDEITASRAENSSPVDTFLVTTAVATVPWRWLEMVCEPGGCRSRRLGYATGVWAVVSGMFLAAAVFVVRKHGISVVSPIPVSAWMTGALLATPLATALFAVAYSTITGRPPWARKSPYSWTGFFAGLGATLLPKSWKALADDITAVPNRVDYGGDLDGNYWIPWVGGRLTGVLATMLALVVFTTDVLPGALGITSFGGSSGRGVFSSLWWLVAEFVAVAACFGYAKLRDAPLLVPPADDG